MKTAAVFALLAGSAAAFAPSSQVGKASTALAGAYDNDIGVIGDLGCWDPLNLVEGQPQERFDRLRGVEIKHGRIAMLAWLGYTATWSGLRLPGLISTSENLSFADIPAGHAAVFKVPTFGLVQILLFAGMLELYGWKQQEGSFPGDFSASSFPVGWGNYATTEEDMIELRTKELNNGRAAQMGLLSLLVHEQLDGKPFIFWDKIEPYIPGVAPH